MDTREFAIHAFDANAFITSDTSAGHVNPELWEKETLGYLKDNLILEKLGKVYNRTNVAGDTFNVTVGVAPVAASAVAETAAVSYQDFTKTQVVFSPSEGATGMQVSQKELDRAFIPVMNEMVEQLGYALALMIDADIYSTVVAGASGNIFVGGGTSVASTDTLDYSTLVSAKKVLRKAKVNPYAIVVNYDQLASLEDEDQFKRFDYFGDQVAKTGLIGTILGIEVFATESVTTASNEAKALMLGKDQQGVPPFGTLYKRMPYILRDLEIDYRQHKVVGVVDYDAKVLRGAGICTITSYIA